jgi:hypothetical protein
MTSQQPPSLSKLKEPEPRTQAKKECAKYFRNHQGKVNKNVNTQRWQVLDY